MKLMPTNWIHFLASLFTALLHGHAYPQPWVFSKLVMLFKKGSREQCDNYRGISLMDSVAKVFDMVLNRRLTSWFTPDREQAGAQRRRGCAEHLVTLRLIIDLARHKRKKLYVIYVDFSKAYDRIPRDLMVRKLLEHGCGSQMTRIIASMYSSTKMILRSAILTSTMGVRQGSPTSCLLFTLVVNDLIRNLKAKCAPDGFLGWLHCLMMMDDTVLLATSRQRALEKMQILVDFCHESGMQINAKKTKFMVINGEADDHRPLLLGSLSVGNCNTYTYLGLVFTQDGSTMSAVKAQCAAKTPHVVKFEAFVQKNSDMAFQVKRKVFDAALSTAILYGCEAWMSPAAIEQAAPMYNGCVRSLLGVRKTTASDLCLVECGVPPVAVKVKAAQKRFFDRLLPDREHSNDDPLGFVWQMANRANTPCARYVRSLENFDATHELESLRNRIRASARTKFVTYTTLMNPSLEAPIMYETPDVPEYMRLVATKFRLSSHSLAIETGRWSRKPREERLCPECKIIQDECHALAQCQLNSTTRRKYAVDFSMPNFFSLPVRTWLKICFELVKNFI
jgi:hypothetical protein